MGPNQTMDGTNVIQYLRLDSDPSRSVSYNFNKVLDIMMTARTNSEQYNVRKCNGVQSSCITTDDNICFDGSSNTAGNVAQNRNRKAAMGKKSNADSFGPCNDWNKQVYNPAPNPTKPLATPTALPLVPYPVDDTMILNTAPVTKPQLRNVAIPNPLSVTTKMDRDGIVMNCFATHQYNINAVEPVQPPSDNAHRVPYRSLQYPGINVNNPATKNAVLILSNCPCVKCKLCLSAEL